MRIGSVKKTPKPDFLIIYGDAAPTLGQLKGYAFVINKTTSTIYTEASDSGKKRVVGALLYDVDDNKVQIGTVRGEQESVGVVTGEVGGVGVVEMPVLK